MVGALLLGAFIFVEFRAEEPILPLRLFRNSVFTSANIAAFSVSMVVFGATIYIPVYAQGVLGVSATNSGLILLPLMIGFIVVGIAAGLLITRTGQAMPLRDTVSTPEEARREFLDTMSQSSGRDELVPSLNHYDNEGARTRERVLALQMDLLVRESRREDRGLLRRAVTEIGDGDLSHGQAILERTARCSPPTTRSRWQRPRSMPAPWRIGRARKGGVLSEDIRKDIAVRVAEGRDHNEVLSGHEKAMAENFEAVDVAQLRGAANDLATVLLLDLDVKTPVGASATHR